MTYAMCGEIHFPAHNGRKEFLIRRFSECTIESSWKSLTDKADITLPKKVKDFDRMAIGEWFRPGDPVEFWLGYDGNLVREFSGYISDVGAGIPLVISCEDEMYKLKRQTVSVSQTACTLKKLLELIAPGYEIACDDGVEIGDVRYSKVAPSQILEDLQKKKIYSWFEGQTLHAYGRSQNDTVVSVQLERTLGESLKAKPIEDTLVIMSLIRKKGKKLRVTYGEENAGKRLIKEISGIEISEAELKKEAEKLYLESKQPGLDGDVTLCGTPSVTHGMQMELSSDLYPEKDGTYYVDIVTKKYVPGSYSQSCKLGNEV